MGQLVVSALIQASNYIFGNIIALHRGKIDENTEPKGRGRLSWPWMKSDGFPWFCTWEEQDMSTRDPGQFRPL